MTVFAIDSILDKRIGNSYSGEFWKLKNLNYKILASATIAIVIVSYLAIFFVIDLEEQLRLQQSRYIPERVVFVNEDISEFFEGTQELKKFSSHDEVQKFITALATSKMEEHYSDRWISANGGFRMEEAMEVRATGSISLDRTVFPIPMPEPEPGAI